MLDLSRQYACLRREVLAAVTRVCDSQHYILSEEVAAFEREFARVCDTRRAVGCASGTDALWLALAAAGVAAGDEVITTAFSFFATASSIIRAGARPVFVDIDPDTQLMNLDLVHSLLSTRVIDAIVLTHLFGLLNEIEEFCQTAEKLGVPVIEEYGGFLANGRFHPAGRFRSFRFRSRR